MGISIIFVLISSSYLHIIRTGSNTCRSSRPEYDERVCLTSGSDGVLLSVEYRLHVGRDFESQQEQHIRIGGNGRDYAGNHVKNPLPLIKIKSQYQDLIHEPHVLHDALPNHHKYFLPFGHLQRNRLSFPLPSEKNP